MSIEDRRDLSSTFRIEGDGDAGALSIDGVTMTCSPIGDFLWVAESWAASARLKSMADRPRVRVRLRASGCPWLEFEGAPAFERLLPREAVVNGAGTADSRASRLFVRRGPVCEVDVVVPAVHTAGERVELSVAAVATALAIEGRGLLHGAAFRFEGVPIVAVAAEGGGKSTLAASAVAAGGLVYDDDTLVVRKDAPGIAVGGLRQSLSLRFVPQPDGALAALRKCGEIREDRFVVSLGKVAAGVGTGVVPEQMWFLSPGHEGKSRVVRSLSLSEALSRLVPATNSFLLGGKLRSVVRDLMPLFVGLIEQSPSYEVLLGEDLLRSPSATLSRILRESRVLTHRPTLPQR